AHLDGLRIAGQFGWQLCQKALQEPGPGEVFAAAVLAFGGVDSERIKTVLKAATPEPRLQRALVSALGWLPFDEIQTHIRELATSAEPTYRRVAIAACAVHRRDPGQLLPQALSDTDLQLRARALKACGELGKTELLPQTLLSLSADDVACRFFAAWSAARLGNRSPEVISVLRELALKPGRYAERALDMALRVMSLNDAEAWQRQLRADPAKQRLAALAIGTIGDPALAGDLIALMKVPAVARPAGAAFALLTGVDLAYEDLDGEPPEGFEAGPSENPADENVAMDPDENLRWPLPDEVANWWKKSGRRFTSGRRYLLGKEITEQSLREALVKAYQPQRATAALELALRQPAQPLFEVRARAQMQEAQVLQWNL
ncbi:MAG TPA: TIGR02270 family protein, partial [Verrucomicrobiae bacterium]